jgi:hypothetical protein
MSTFEQVRQQAMKQFGEMPGRTAADWPFIFGFAFISWVESNIYHLAMPPESDTETLYKGKSLFAKNIAESLYRGTSTVSKFILWNGYGK